MNNLKSPFICCVQKAIPLAYDESLSYYETLCALIKYIKDVVTPTTNDLIDKVQELETYVTNYFNNLDVQEEINNKLDEMAESGQLTDIIAQYLQLAGMLCYDNVANMKSAENLTNGSIARTLGYHTINDGGESIYKIRNITNEDVVDEAFIIALADETLIAELICGNTINPIQMGAYGDNTHDDSESLQKGLNALHNRKCLIYDLLGKYYLVNTGLHADSMYKCTIKNGYLRSNNFNIDEDVSKNFILYTTVVENQLQDPSSGGYCFEDNTLENLTLDCELQDGLGCLSILTYMRLTIFNCDFRRYKTYGIRTSDSPSLDGHEMIVNNCYFRANFYYETNTEGIGIYITKPDNQFTNLIIVGGKYGIYNKSSYNYHNSIHIYSVSDYALYITNAFNNYDNMYFDGKGIYIYNPWCCVFNNCEFLGTNAFSPISLDKQAGGVELTGLIFDNCTIRFINESSQNIITLLNGSFIINSSENYKNVFNFNKIINAVDNTYIVASDFSIDITSEVTFAESDYVENRTQVLKKNGWIYITYQGPSAIHSADESIITIPSRYRAKNSNFSIPFISNETYYGNLYMFNGVIKIGALSDTTNAGRISFTLSYPYN